MSRRNLVILERRRRNYRLMIGVILATLPCYFCGIVVLVGFSGRDTGRLDLTRTALALTASSTVEQFTATPGTPTATYTPGGPTVTLPFTPTQFIPASHTPTPTNTPTPTLTPTITLTPTVTGTTTVGPDITATVNALLTQAVLNLTGTAAAGQTPTPPTVTPVSPTPETPTTDPGVTTTP